MSRKIERAEHVPAESFIEKHRVDALTDGVYAIAVTLLVLELRLPELPDDVSDPALMGALLNLVPRGLVWLLSFWVMILFWQGQQRLNRVVATLDRRLVLLDMLQLALISLLPFSTTLIGQHGNHVIAAVIYSAHLLFLALLSLFRVRHLRQYAQLQVPGLETRTLHALSIRARVIVAATAASLLLAFFIPGWNMLAMLVLLLQPVFARA